MTHHHLARAAIAFAVMLLTLPVAARQTPAASSVPVYVSVVDSAGRPVKGLSVSDFEIRDQGKIQAVTSLKAAGEPLSIVMLVDASGSTSGNRDSMLVGAELFMGSLAPVDRVQVGVFADALTIDPEFTTDRSEPMRWLRLHPFKGNGTAVWNSAYVSLDALARQPGRRALVLLSDGEDTISRRTASDVIKRALEIDCRIDFVSFWPPFFPGGGGPSQPRVTYDVRSVVEHTGGMLLVRQRAPDLNALVAALAADLHEQYVLEFAPTVLDDKPHKLEVRVKTKGMTVRARRGYGPHQ